MANSNPKPTISAPRNRCHQAGYCQRPGSCAYILLSPTKTGPPKRMIARPIPMKASPIPRAASLANQLIDVAPTIVIRQKWTIRTRCIAWRAPNHSTTTEVRPCQRSLTSVILGFFGGVFPRVYDISHRRLADIFVRVLARPFGDRAVATLH